jgi:glycosyltransferase involved in cell wall biosynthesis
MSIDLSVVILTLNEETNLTHAVRSVAGWARETFIVDSFSTDRTVKLAKELGCVVAQHRFESYGQQRNYALDQLPIQSEWVLFLDADEWVPEALKEEIAGTLARKPKENGFFLCWKFLWMGKWIRHGYYPSWILRLFRRGTARCEERSVNERLKLDGEAGYLREPFVHEDRKGLAHWIAKHSEYARREAEELLKTPDASQLAPSLFGSQGERIRWFQQKVWNRLPPLVRPLGYFGYRYVLRLGFLDGREALVYHLLHALWYRLLIDAYYLELRSSPTSASAPPAPLRAIPREPRVGDPRGRSS